MSAAVDSFITRNRLLVYPGADFFKTNKNRQELTSAVIVFAGSRIVLRVDDDLAHRKGFPEVR